MNPRRPFRGSFPTWLRRLASVLSPAALLPVVLLAPAFAAAPAPPLKLRVSINEPLIAQLAVGLGAFAQEGIELEVVKVESVSPESYLMQQPLVDGKLDASFHWFQHVIFGARHGLPLKAVMMVADTPHLKIVVANRVKNEITTAADFRGRHVAEGAGYATKSLITSFLAHRAGVPREAYHAVGHQVEGRQETVIRGLRDGSIDIASFMEPMTSAIAATGEVTTLFDLTTRAGTVQALGAPWPSHSLFLSADFIAKNPATVQRLVNAFVRAMRFANRHTPEEIAARLPASYFAGKDRATELARIAKTLPGYARDNHAFTRGDLQPMVDAVLWSRFDDSVEGRFRAGGAKSLRTEDLYDNRFVEVAMAAIK